MSARWKKIFIRKNCDVLTCYSIESGAYKEIWRITGKIKEYVFGYLKDKHFNYYHSVEIDPQIIGRNLYKKYFDGKRKIIDSYKKGLLFLKKNRIETAKCKKLLYRELTDINLLGALRLCKNSSDFVTDAYSIMPWWALEAWQHDFEDKIGILIRKRNLSGKYEEIIESLLKPWKDTATRKAGKELKNGVSISKLVQKYQFLRSWTVVWNRPIDENWIKSTAQTESNRPRLKNLIKILRPNKIEAAFISLAPFILFFKDWRDDLRRRHVFEWSFLFDEIAKFFEVERDDLGYFTWNELENMLKDGRFDSELLAQRKNKEFIFTIDLKELKFVVLPGVPKKYEKFINQAEKTGSNLIVKGIIACPGVARGPVRIIKNFHDIKKVENGEILFANTTHPNYLAGMKKAIAFVTDEGGIASHAAIVAREMRKPCLVGAKIATKIFRDGDMVEVDAEKGIVKLC